MRIRVSFIAFALLGAVLLCIGEARAQIDYGNRLGQREGERLVYPIRGVNVQMDALDPTIMRWYMPQELFMEYGRSQWDYTNYARQPYRRYLDPNQEGTYFYDVYGNQILRGWRIYDWRQTQPTSLESSALTKGGKYASWFNRLVISSDAAGDYSYSIIIGDEIRTTLTPMTFRKAGFNGVITSLASSRMRFTGLFGRLTAPIVLVSESTPTIAVDSFTNLTGGRLETSITDKATLGFTFINAHNGNGARKSLNGNPMKGRLTSGQLSQRLDFLAVRLSDDSPEDGEGGAVLFSDDVEITLTLMRPVAVGDSLQMVPRDTVIVGSSIGFRSVREGGELKGGFLTADGGESITLKYSLAPEGEEEDLGSLRLRLQQRLDLSLAEAENVITSIKKLRFRLVLANDYKVEVASDRQSNSSGQPQFLPVTRAEGNIKNRLNQREIVFDYGLPTANQIFGVTAELRDFYGFDAYAEFNVNNQYRKHPNTQLKEHRTFSGILGDEQAIAFMANLSRHSGPWHFFAEAFGMEYDYTTSLIPVDGRGLADYSPEAINTHYDLVEDNDDQDRHPDQLRAYQGSLIPPRTTTTGNFQIDPAGQADPAVFPGYDENNDFISDFNQNSNGDQENYYPDYEEPFLRHNSDRPEFLIGMDMNNNGWGDRFENDDEPDYPYKKDHWGYNVYGSVEIIPRVKVTVGRLDQKMRQTSRRNRVSYGIFSLDEDLPQGRVRVFDMLKRAADDIPDNLVQWIMPEPEFGDPGESSGSNQPVADQLAAQDTWINTLYLDWKYRSRRQWATQHKFKWETWRQRNADPVFASDADGQVLLDAEGEPVVAFDPLGPDGRNGREKSGFFGLINKADYEYRWHSLVLSPRIKSEVMELTPFGRTTRKRHSWDLIPSFLVRFSILKESSVEMGWEGRRFYNLRGEEGELADGSLTGDFRGTVLAAQLSNKRDYLGYRLTTLLGVRYDRRSLEVIGGKDETRTSGLAYLTVFAGLRD